MVVFVIREDLNMSRLINQVDKHAGYCFFFSLYCSLEKNGRLWAMGGHTRRKNASIPEESLPMHICPPMRWIEPGL